MFDLNENPMEGITLNKISTEEVTAICTGTKNQDDAELCYKKVWYKEKLEERDKEIIRLQSIVDNHKDYQRRIKVEFEKVKHHIFKGAACGVGDPSFQDGRPSLYFDVLESTVQSVDSAFDSFIIDFVAYSEERMHKPANEIWVSNFRDMYFSKEGHWILALEAYFFEKMFVGFENESFMTDAESVFLDKAKLRKESYEYFKCVTTIGSSSSCASFSKDIHFRTFCEQKFHFIVPEATLLEPCEDKQESFGFTLAKINLSKSFMVMAMKVWTLHKLCFSFEPTVDIFRPRQGFNLNSKYMKSAVRLEADDCFIPKVGMMIAPGFRLRGAIIKSQIYPAARATVIMGEIQRYFSMQTDKGPKNDGSL